MKKLYCEYCGALLEDGCICLREREEASADFLEDYYNSPETQAGWANEDLIYNSRREQ